MSTSVKHQISQRFGHLTIISDVPIKKSASRNLSWLCRCDCGKEAYFKGDKLRSGRTKSCGCAQGENHLIKYNQDFRSAGVTGAFNSWNSLIKRAHHKTKDAKTIRNYINKGIGVCERWLDFNNFFNDMGERPAGKTIGRENNALGYSPENCRWEDNDQQNSNRDNTFFVEYNGKRTPLFIICKVLGANSGAVYGRIRAGWPMEKALTTPVRRRRPNRRGGCDTQKTERALRKLRRVREKVKDTICHIKFPRTR